MLLKHWRKASKRREWEREREKEREKERERGRTCCVADRLTARPFARLESLFYKVFGVE